MMSDETSANEKALNPTVKRLGLISFLADVSSEMLYPITPLFLTTVLGASLTSVGFIEGLAEAIASLLKTYSGFWSDRIQKRKPFIWMGYLFAALAKPITGAATSWMQILFARSFDRTGKGLRTAPRDALLADTVPKEMRGAAFGWHRMMDTLGATVGPLLAILYLQFFSDLRIIYYLAFIPGLLAVMVALGIREKASELRFHSTPPSWTSLFQLPSEFVRYLIAWGVFAIVNSSDVFLLLKVQKAGVGLTEVILMYCFYNLFYALGSPYLGSLSDRIARKNILSFGLIVFTLVYLGFIYADQKIHFWILFGVYGFYMAATDGVGKALAIDLLGENQKATAVGYLGTVNGFATIIASTMAGFLWDHVGASAPFWYGAGGALIATVALQFFQKTKTVSG